MPYTAGIIEDLKKLAERLRCIASITEPPERPRHGWKYEPISPPDKFIQQELRDAGELVFRAMKDGFLPQVPADSIKVEWLNRAGTLRPSPFFKDVVIPALIPSPGTRAFTRLAADACDIAAAAIEAAEPAMAEAKAAKAAAKAAKANPWTYYDPNHRPTQRVYRCRRCGWQTLLLYTEPGACNRCHHDDPGFEVVTAGTD